MRLPRIITLIAFLFGAGAFLAALSGGSPGAPRIVEPLPLDAKLARVLHHASFTGRVGSSIEKRLGRPMSRWSKWTRSQEGRAGFNPRRT